MYQNQQAILYYAYTVLNKPVMCSALHIFQKTKKQYNTQQINNKNTAANSLASLEEPTVKTALTISSF